MRTTIKSVAAAAAMLTAACAHGFSLPLVGAGTEPNQWSRNMSGVLDAARNTGYPIFLVMINDSSSGQGCEHCKYFVERTLNIPEFDAIVSDYKFYMVLLNIWGADSGQSQPNYGGVSSSVFFNYFYKYNSDSGYPLVAVLRPDGTKYKGWGDTTNPSTRGTILHQYIRNAIADLSKNDSTKFDLAAESGNTVTVQVSGATVQPGTWKGVVTRSGESETSGSVTISLSGSNAGRYSVSPATLAWDGTDGSKTFTVTGPSSSDGGLVSDTITVSIKASGFDGSEVSYGVSSQAVTFKDSRVKQSLAEFAAANRGLGGLASTGGTWFVPASGNVLETLTAASSSLKFVATEGGILTVGAGANNAGSMDVTAGGDTLRLEAGNPVRFGVAAGQSITFKATADGTASGSIGFAKFAFEPLAVTLKTPKNGAEIAYTAMMADKKLVNMEWSASRSGCTFEVKCGNAAKDMGAATSANAIDLGFVSTKPSTATYAWQVTASYAAADLRGTAKGTASASFKVMATPTFDNVPAEITAYKAVGANLDLSVSSSGAGAVTYSASGLPAGLKINKDTGEISGSPLRVESSKVTVTAKGDFGSASTTFTISVGKLPKAYTKPTFVCFCFDNAGDVKASATVKMLAAGKWTAKIFEGGSIISKRGQLSSRKDGRLAIVDDSLDIAFDGTTWWTGKSHSRRVYGRAMDKADAQWKGTWNSGVFTSASATLGGWVTAKVAGSGQVTFTGSIANRIKISGKGSSAVFPASFVAANLPKWAGHGDVRFVQMSKQAGCYALCADGMLGGSFTFQSVTYNEIEGSKWPGTSIDALDGAVFKTIGGGNVTVPVTVAGRKLVAGPNDIAARLSATLRSGRVNASYRNGTSVKATGVLYLVNGTPKAVGGGNVSSEPFVFVIE